LDCLRGSVWHRRTPKLHHALQVKETSAVELKPAAGMKWLAMVVIAAVAIAAYWNSFSTPFVFSDRACIVENPTIRSLWPLSGPLGANFRDGRPVDGRPILNLSFAINHALHGLDVRGYHATNLLLHVLAAWALLAILRRTFRSSAVPGWLRSRADLAAGCAALLWTVHPLQTEAVTYVVQRAEALASLFYLFTLYAFLRGASTERGWWWFPLAVVCCLLGMATKEMVATAPVIVLLYDRTFLAGSFREALRRRWPWYFALASTWLLLIWLIVRSGLRGGGAEFVGGGAFPYFLTQCGAVVRYFGLVFWPGPLVFDYGHGVVTSFGVVAAPFFFLLALGLFTAWALWKRPVLGFALGWVAITLSPTSSVIQITTQTIAEHRMYLPLAAIVALVTAGAFRWLPGWGAGGMCGILILALAVRTAWRNEDYRPAFVLWSDTVRKWPGNERAWLSGGMELVKAGQADAAMPWLLEAVRLAPRDASAWDGLGNALVVKGDYAGATEKFLAAIRLRPNAAHMRINAAQALMFQGRYEEAKAQVIEVLKVDPESAVACGVMGLLEMANGKAENAIAHFEKAVEFDPLSPDLRNNFGVALMQVGRRGEAAAQFREALRLEPEFERAQTNLQQVEAALK